MLAYHFFRPSTFLPIFVLILVCWLQLFVLPFGQQFSSLFQYAGYNHFRPPILPSIFVLISVCCLQPFLSSQIPINFRPYFSILEYHTFRPYFSWYQLLYNNCFRPNFDRYEINGIRTLKLLIIN